MTNSRQIAGLIGPTAIAMGLSEMLNPHIWAAVTPPITFQAGTMLFVAGLAIVRAHNSWRGDWTVVVTLVGWVALVLGAFRIFFPELAQRTVENSSIPLISQVLVLAIGLFLTFKAFAPEVDKASSGRSG